MRRLILIVMMCLLPLQWSWAAAAGVCEHESGRTHFGHHEHQHTGTDHQAMSDADQAPHADASWNHPDCQSCHGLGAAVAPSVATREAPLRDVSPPPDYGRVLPEPPVESLLRPPLNFVA